MSICSKGQIAFSISLLFTHVIALKIWDSPAKLGTAIPAGCRAALSSEIACPGLITATDIVNSVPFNETDLESYCQSGCRSAIQNWASLVGTKCGDTEYKFGNVTKQSGNDIALPFLWAQNMACLENSSDGNLCLPTVTNHTIKPCEDCTLQYVAGMLNSTYGRQRVSDKAYSSLLSSCSASPTNYPHGTVSFPPVPSSTSNSTAKCLGKDYTVVKGDTCESIASANKVAYYRLLSDNSLDLKCASLIPGMNLCIGDSCTLHTVSANETCKSILAGKDFTIVELLGWNPIIHSNCDNLNSLKGHTICLSPPDSKEWDIPLTVTYNDTFTLPSGNWGSLPSARDAPNATQTDPYAFGTIPRVTGTAALVTSTPGASGPASGSAVRSSTKGAVTGA
ncbi:hypothetical protein PENVUL_c008G06108 [Penicillium vulpinum]|uniref:LysM domain-containing protein n=1 Tax=Penicillium vulpinum TaxID=29845 RepID=A0A1V6S405_9EURO|nr:hypothetical protein PENVUL_c008G06108 [Penicillium vulpinum]